MNNAININFIRSQVQAEAEKRGTTVSADMDELERLTGSKDYADAFRNLYGIPITKNQKPQRWTRRCTMSFFSARENSGLTQREVAAHMGVDQSAVSFWETGKTRPRASLLVKLAGLYHCTVDDLLREDNPE